MPRFDQLLGHDRRAGERHVDQEGTGDLAELELHGQGIDHFDLVDGLDLRAVGVAGVRRAQPVEAELDVLGGERVAVVKGDAVAQLERVLLAVRRHFVGFGETGNRIGVRVEQHQRRIHLLDHDVRHAARAPHRIEAGRIGRERRDQGAAVLLCHRRKRHRQRSHAGDQSCPSQRSRAIQNQPHHRPSLRTIIGRTDRLRPHVHAPRSRSVGRSPVTVALRATPVKRGNDAGRDAGTGAEPER